MCRDLIRYPDQATRVAGAYSILDFQKAPEGMSADSYIWNIERSATPESTLSPSSPLVSIEYVTIPLSLWIFPLVGFLDHTTSHEAIADGYIAP